MDQVKNILKQLVKQRFWIGVGAVALVPLIAYFAIAGSIHDATNKKVAEIQGAYKGAQPFASGDTPTREYAEIVKEKKDRLKGEVARTAKSLYERQLPVLTWPKEVEDRIPAWGYREWPKEIGSQGEQQAINDYVDHYQDYIEQVYQSFHPFNPEDGSGIVAAAPRDVLLTPPVFNVQTPPTLKQIWDAQERFWLQRALFEVIATVNKDAKDWDSAAIKQITRLEVAVPTALDQLAATKAATKLEQATEIVQEGTPPPPPPPVAGAAGAAQPQAATDAAAVYYTKGAGSQYRLFPVALEVLMEQEKIQDLLAELQNSPMAIQVNEVQWTRPPGPILKPVKAEAGEGASVLAQYRIAPGAGQTAGGRGRTELLVQPYNMIGMGGPGAAAAAVPKAAGTDVRTRFQERRRDAARKDGAAKGKDDADEKPEAPNPYYNVVQVTMYGQARFYTKPTEAKGAASAGAGAPAPGPGTPAPAPAPPVND